MKKFIVSIMVLLFAFFLVACGDDTDLQKIADEISITYQTGDTATAITKDITLPNAEIEGATITWASNNAAIKVEGNKGVVTRGDADTNVTLTVTVTKDGKEAKATFNVVVKAKEPVVVDESVTVLFTVTLPAYTPMEDSIYIVGDFTPASGIPSWTPDASEGKMTRVNATTATFELKFEKVTESITISYKYTRGSWDKVEKDASKGELENRTLTITSAQRTVNQADTVATWSDLDAPLTDQEKLDAAKVALTITQTNVTEDFELPLTGLHSTIVEWASNNAAIEIDGADAIVTRGAEDVTVTLTATITLGELTTTKTFSVVVKAEETQLPTDQEKVDEAKEALTIDEEEVTADFELPLEGLNGTTITWESDDNAIEIDGANATVTRGTEDVTVTLTATITLNDATSTKTFEVTVKAEEVIVIDLEAIVESIAITFADENDEDNVTANLVLPNDDVQGVTITWASDKDAIKVEGSTGVVKRSLLDVTVTLTVTATLDDESKTATHVVVVKGIEATDIVDVYDLANDAIVTIQGVVTGTVGPNKVAIEDETGAIAVESATLFSELFALVGKEVKLTAVKNVTQTAHKLQGSIEYVVIGDADLPEALDLQALELANWSNITLLEHQSKLVKVDHLKVVSVTGTSTLTVVALDELTSLSITIYIESVYADALVDDYAFEVKVGDFIKVEAHLGWYLNTPEFIITAPGQIVQSTAPEYTDELKVQFDFDALNVPLIVTADLDLPILGQYGSSITWESDKPAVIDTEGKVTSPTELTVVVLTATIKSNDLEVEKDFEVYVFPEGLTEEVIYETGFEESDGFASSTSYNNVEPKEIGGEGHKWTVKMGTPTTTQAASMGGSQTLQMRYYTTGNAAEVIGELVSLFKVDDVTRISFDARYHNGNNGLDVKLSYSIDGIEWVDIDSYELTDFKQTFEADLVSINEPVFIKFSVELKETAPSGTVYLLIDNIKVFGMVAPKPEYEVDFDLGYPEAEVLDSVIVIDGDKVTQPSDPEREGFIFLGWFLNDEKFDFETPITENIILVAKWEDASQMMNVTFMDGVEEYLVIPVVSGAKVEKPEDPVKQGFVFVAWQLDGVDFDFDTEIEEDIILVAKWEEVQEAETETVTLLASESGYPTSYSNFTWSFGTVSFSGVNLIRNGNNTEYTIQGHGNRPSSITSTDLGLIHEIKIRNANTGQNAAASAKFYVEVSSTIDFSNSTRYSFGSGYSNDTNITISSAGATVSDVFTASHKNAVITINVLGDNASYVRFVWENGATYIAQIDVVFSPQA